MPVRLDFSAFHPLDHWPFTRRCESLPGGSLRHLSITWQLQRRDQMLKPLYRVFRCPFGRHCIDVWYRGDGKRILPVCRYCPYQRLPSEADIDGFQKLPKFDLGDVEIAGLDIDGEDEDDDA